MAIYDILQTRLNIFNYLSIISCETVFSRVIKKLSDNFQIRVNMDKQSSNVLSKADRIVERLENVKNLPAVPKVLEEISLIFDSPDISVNKISKIVGKDQSLMLKILSIANSPLYGLRRNVTSVENAILVLGIHEVKSIVTSLKMSSSINVKADKYFDPNKFWHHSIVVGILAQRISKDLGFNFEGNGFVAGMLHDMGILVIHEFLQNEYKEIIEHAQTNNITFLEAEYKVMGVSHQEIGEFLAEKWSLPSVYTDALRYHHQPTVSFENKYLSSILHVADYLISIYDENIVLWDEDYKLDLSVIEQLNFLSPDEFEEFVEAYREDSIEAAKSQVV